MPIQDFKIYTDNAYNGQVSNSANSTIVTGIMEADLEMGRAVKRGSKPGTVAGAGEANVFGVAIRDLNWEAAHRPSDGTTVLKKGNNASILRQGYINLKVTAGAAVAGKAVHVIASDGKFAGTGGVACTNVTWEGNGAAGSIVRARIDIVAG